MIGERIMVSVIIPIYNAEKYIEECIQSIVNQTYNDLEILCIFDGSTDESYKICEKISKKDSRVKLIIKENGGVSSTRNLGIEVSCGEFLIFVDADDYIEKNCIEKMVKLLEEHNSDIVQVGYFRNFEDKNNSQIEIYEDVSKDDFELSIISMKHDVEMPKELFQFRCVWGKLYKRKLINEIRFKTDTYFFEDGLFNLEILDNVKKITCTTEQLYYYRYDINSANNRFKNDIIEISKTNIKYLKELLEKKDEIIFDEYYSLYVFECLKIIIDSYLFHESNNCTLKEKKNIFQKMLFEELDVNSLSKINNKYIKESFFDRVVVFFLKINFYSIIYYLFEFRKFIKKGV